MKCIILTFALISISLTSCKKENITGEGPVQTQQRMVANFHQVFASGASKIFITKGDQVSVTVKAFGTLLPYLETTVSKGVLKIAFKDNTRVRNDNSEIFITMPSFDALTTEGSGSITITGDFSGSSNFDLQISGSSDVSLEKGSSKVFSATIEGSGDLKAFGFEAEEASVKISGSGNTEIAVSKKLDVKIYGSGNVYYKGNPTIVDSDISGSGKVISQ
ncbi:MAG TPA: head GIN domain-containing protein [Daejeonella sp.]|nr:head GIN domain-containing protein [Daejeonella sp.]